MKIVTIKDLIGKTLKDVRITDENRMMHFLCDNGEAYLMYHSQDCCEDVYISDINGNLENLIGTPILKFEERIEEGTPEKQESATWTFYTIVTAKGYVDIRWVGESSGDYSEKVDFDEDYTLLN